MKQSILPLLLFITTIALAEEKTITELFTICIPCSTKSIREQGALEGLELNKYYPKNYNKELPQHRYTMGKHTCHVLTGYAKNEKPKIYARLIHKFIYKRGYHLPKTVKRNKDKDFKLQFKVICTADSDFYEKVEQTLPSGEIMQAIHIPKKVGTCYILATTKGISQEELDMAAQQINFALNPQLP